LAGFTLWLAASLACDVFIAAAMLVILTEARRSTILKETNTLISRMVAHTIQTGAITAITAAVEIALFVTFPTDNKHVVPALILGKLYSNCLVATLNARQGTYLSTQSETSNSNISIIFSLGPSNGLLSPRTDKNSMATGVSIERVQSVSGDDSVRIDQHAMEMKPYTPSDTAGSNASFDV